MRSQFDGLKVKFCEARIRGRPPLLSQVAPSDPCGDSRARQVKIPGLKIRGIALRNTLQQSFEAAVQAALPRDMLASHLPCADDLRAYRECLQGGNAGYFTTDSCIYDQKIFTNAGRSVPAVDVRCELSWLYVVAEGAAPKAP